MTYFVQNIRAVEGLRRELVAAGFAPFVGVRCAALATLHEALDVTVGVLTVPREDNAIGIAAGVALAGGYPAVLLPDSGPGTAANAIASAVAPHTVPILLVIGLSAESTTDRDAMIRLSEQVLDEFGIESVPLDPAAPAEPVDRVSDIVRERLRPAALLLPAEMSGGQP